MVINPICDSLEGTRLKFGGAVHAEPLNNSELLLPSVARIQENSSQHLGHDLSWVRVEHEFLPAISQFTVVKGDMQGEEAAL
jgi:hypothetical protein